MFRHPWIAPITAASDGSQTQFSMTAVKAAALDDADLPPSSVITVQTQVAMSLKLANVSGVDTLTVMYPMLNAIAQVTQVK